MSGSQVVQDWYSAMQAGDLESLLQAFSPDIVWYQAEGHPYQRGGEPWVGPDAVRDRLLSRVAIEWDGFNVDVRDIREAGEEVVVEGRYTGTFKATGKKLDSQFCHVWRVKDGKLARFRQYMDTAQLLSVTGTTLAGDLADRLANVGQEHAPGWL
jgi:ketosteroid isomerase-like protein